MFSQKHLMHFKTLKHAQMQTKKKTLAKKTLIATTKGFVVTFFFSPLYKKYPCENNIC